MIGPAAAAGGIDRAAFDGGLDILLGQDASHRRSPCSSSCPSRAPPRRERRRPARYRRFRPTRPANGCGRHGRARRSSLPARCAPSRPCRGRRRRPCGGGGPRPRRRRVERSSKPASQGVGKLSEMVCGGSMATPWSRRDLRQQPCRPSCRSLPCPSRASARASISSRTRDGTTLAAFGSIENSPTVAAKCVGPAASCMAHLLDVEHKLRGGDQRIRHAGPSAWCRRGRRGPRR